MGSVKSARLLDFLTYQGFSPAVAADLMLDGKVHLLGREDKPMHQAKDPGISCLAGDRISVELHIKDAQAGIKAGLIQPEQINPSSRSNHQLLIWTIGQADCHIAVGLHREEEAKAVETDPSKHLEAKTWLETNYHTKPQDKSITLNTNSTERMKTPRSPDRSPNMSLQESYILFWKHAFQFKGRISRRSFWITVLANAIAFTVIVLLVAFFSALVGSDISPAWGALLTIYALATGAASVTLQLRRIRDTGLSPWLILILFVPYIGSVITLTFYILPSKDQSTRRSTQNPIAKHNRATANSSNTTTSRKTPDDGLADLAIHQKDLEASLRKIRDKDSSK